MSKEVELRRTDGCLAEVLVGDLMRQISTHKHGGVDAECFFDHRTDQLDRVVLLVDSNTL